MHGTNTNMLPAMKRHTYTFLSFKGLHRSMPYIFFPMNNFDICGINQSVRTNPAMANHEHTITSDISIPNKCIIYSKNLILT